MRKLFFLFAIFAVVGSLQAQIAPVSSEGVGIGGYDPVAYFEQERAVKGLESLSSEYDGVTYLFSSSENKGLFDESPEAYLPAYGGYCAYAVSKGYTAPVDPTAWTVHEGSLYLNYSRGVRRLFTKNLDDNIAAADKNWDSLKK